MAHAPTGRGAEDTLLPAELWPPVELLPLEELLPPEELLLPFVTSPVVDWALRLPPPHAAAIESHTQAVRRMQESIAGDDMPRRVQLPRTFARAPAAGSQETGESASGAYGTLT
jgi:hypothetical protein